MKEREPAKYNRFGHLSGLGRTQRLKEFLGIGTEYDELVEQEQELFGLTDWYIETMYAEDETLERMRKRGDIAMIDSRPDLQRATIYFDEEEMKDSLYLQKEIAEQVVDHELAHLILNPYNLTGEFRTGEEMEEIKAIHITRACYLLRHAPEQARIKDPTDLKDIIEKAKKVTRLDENHWEIRVEKRDGIYCDEGKRIPAHAHSLYDDIDNRGWGIFGSRQIELKIDEEYIKEEGYYLPDVILREMWWVVVNPYGREETGIMAHQVEKIMKIMQKFGWGNNPERGIAWG